MNVYLIFKFDDYKILHNQIHEFIKTSPQDSIFYFNPTLSKDIDEWEKIASSKIKESEVVIYLRMKGNSGYSEEKMININLELNLAVENNKPIIVYEAPSEFIDKEIVTPKMIYEKDYLDHFRIKYKVISSLTMKKVKNALFDIEGILFQDTSLNKKDQAEILLEEYRIMLETSEKMMDRRQGTNNFYITLCSAMLTAIIAFIATKPSTMIWSAVTCAISAMLCFLCNNWKKTLIAYGLSNQAKYEVLNEIEKRLPASIFTTEWKYGKTIDYSSYSKRETRIPDVFMILFGIISGISMFICVLSICGVIPAYIFQIN